MNKKTLLAVLMLGLFLMPAVVGAQFPPVPVQPTNPGDATFNTDTDFMQVVQNIANFVIAFITILGIIFIVWGAIQYVTAAGDEAAMEKAKTTITYALIGLFIAAMAYALENLVLVQLLA